MNPNCITNFISNIHEYNVKSIRSEMLYVIHLDAESLDDIAAEFDVPVETIEQLQALAPYTEQIYGVGVAFIGVLQELENRGFANW